MKILKNKNKLKGSKIYIDNDLTIKDREIQLKLKRMADQKREKGNRTKVTCKKIQINEKWFVWDNIQERVVEVLERCGDKREDNQFWDYLKGFDIIGMTETWIKEKAWVQIEDKLPVDYKWKCNYAKTIHKRGRAIGGILTGIKKEIEELEEEKEENTEAAMEKLITLISGATTSRLIRPKIHNAVNENWWCTDCREKKKITRKALADWRRGRGTKEEYKTHRKEYKELCTQKKRTKKKKKETI
ncbi:hypothetical protein CBL_20075 [Carabus blaptoides fortunei]